MSNNARNTIISTVGILAAGATIVTGMYYGEKAGELANDRMVECVAAGGTYVETSPELCLVGTETR